jgi:chorismate mutase
MVKNPVNPDLELWIGAIERIYNTGIKRILAIHRGFSTYKPEIYRNPPMWEIPIELRRRFPNLPIICDPSHISGNKSLISTLSQRAMDLDFDGLMIEVHNNPDEAYSDKDQQLLPEELDKLLNDLILRESSTDNPEFVNYLESLRLKIDRLDSDIINLLAQRMKISKEIGIAKKDNGVTIFQMNRWSKLFDDRVATTIKAGLSDQFATDFIQSIHKESIRQQTEVMNNGLDK